MGNVTPKQKKKKIKKGGGVKLENTNPFTWAFLSFPFLNRFSLQFFLKFEEKIFWWAQRENTQVLPLFFLLFPFNQTPTKNTLFTSFFSIFHLP